MNVDNLIKVRKDLSLTQREMALLIGVKNNTYSDYEVKKAIISIDKLNIISNKYNFSLDYLIGLTSRNNTNFKHIEIDFKMIGLRLKEFRKSRGLSQTIMAKELGTFHSRVSEYENGKRLSIPVLIKYSKLMNKSVDYICGKEKEL